MGALTININIQITNISLTTLINSSNIIQNQQYASSSDFEETDLDLYTLPTTNNSNQLAPVYFETKNASHSNITSASSTNNSSNQMATLFPINITDTGSVTSSLSSTLSMMNSTATIFDNDMTINLGVSVAPVIKLF